MKLLNLQKNLKIKIKIIKEEIDFKNHITLEEIKIKEWILKNKILILKKIKTKDLSNNRIIL